MPETTETTTIDRPVEEVFRYLADFSNLAEWDPTFDRSERLDDGPLRVGSRFHVVGSTAGVDLDLTLEIVDLAEPNRVELRGSGDGFSTREEITVAPVEGGSEVTYTSAFDTDKPDWVDAATKPAFTLVGKAAINGLERELGRD
jgi:uncharacterized protein YndB with AHSA1/START domain